MSIKFNGTTLPVGSKQYFGSTQIKDIIFNGVNVWHYDSAAPVITVTSSTADRPTASYTLTGTVTDVDSGIASVTINGTAVTLSGNSFSKTYTLSIGANTFTIVAKDTAGNQATKSITVNYVNQKDNTNYNWSQTYSVENIHRNNRGDIARANSEYVTIGGTGYVYYQRTPNKANYDHDKGGYEFATAIAEINSTIPLPKGISYVACSGNCGGLGEPNGSLSITIYDATTNTNIASQSRTSSAGSLSVAANITAEQSLHNLYVVVVGSGYGRQSTDSQAWCGIDVPTFSYY